MCIKGGYTLRQQISVADSQKQLNALYIIDKYLEIKEGILPKTPITAICEIAVTEGQSAMAVQEEDAKAFVSLMRLAPNGIYRRNIKMNGFVVVSSNMGVVRTEEDYIMVAVSPRSSVASLQEDTKSRFALLAETFGFEIERISIALIHIFQCSCIF